MFQDIGARSFHFAYDVHLLALKLPYGNAHLGFDKILCEPCGQPFFELPGGEASGAYFAQQGVREGTIRGHERLGREIFMPIHGDLEDIFGANGIVRVSL
jgi:hypothetical protein